MKALPKRVLITRQEEGTNDEYLQVTESANSIDNLIIDTGDTKLVGEYTLTKTIKVKNTNVILKRIDAL